ncbi:hypothetical protein EDC01DRAFT_785974 [Geopyxis carbonaria]|nr:hypothetical protein EDC01DRAFT_785974 [Geopyxis carbonaria]
MEPAFVNRLLAILLFAAVGAASPVAYPDPAAARTAGKQSNVNRNSSKPHITLVRGWVAEPKGRGTFGILLTCLLTLFLCIWTTVHVNIDPVSYPEPVFPRTIWAKVKTFFLELRKKRWFRKMFWSIMGLIFPEVTVAIAAYERLTGRMLRAAWHCKHSKFSNATTNEKMCKLDPNKEEVKCVSNEFDEKYQLHRWGNVRILSYYAVMGGYQIVINDAKTGFELEAEKNNSFTRDFSSKAVQVEGSTAVDSSDIPSEKNGAGATTTLIGTAPQKTTEPAAEKDMRINNDSPLTEKEFGRATTNNSSRIASDKNGAVATTTTTEINPQKNTKAEAMVLTPLGVLVLAKLGKLPVVTPEQIRDQSKVNQLAKAIVTFQAFWMIFQVCSRAAFQKPVTLLELHTVLHLVCAASMYITWWDKPVDIELPTLIELTSVEYATLKDDVIRELHDWRTNSPPGHKISEDAGYKSNPTNPLYAGRKKDEAWTQPRAGLGKIFYHQLFFNESEGKVVSPFVSFQEYFKIIAKAYARIIDSKNTIWKEGLMLTGVGVVYGGVHLATWNNHFANEYEAWGWRICSIITAVSVGGFLLQIWVGGLCFKWLVEESGKPSKKAPSQPAATGDKKTKPAGEVPLKLTAQGNTETKPAGEAPLQPTAQGKTETELAGEAPISIRTILAILATALYEFYCTSCSVVFGFGVFIALLARAFIFVESFISLRELSKGAYDGIPWIDAWTLIS